MIVVYGASGVAGEAVARALVAAGAEVVLAGRDRARLLAVRDELRAHDARIAVAASHDRGALDRVVAGASVVIGCAGPFAQVGGALASAAVAAGAHYLDIAGDQGFLRAMHEEHDAEARQRGTIVLPGLGLGAIGDWAARWAAQAVAGERVVQDATAPRGSPPMLGRLCDDDPLDELIVGHAVDGFAPAPGARRSLIDAVTSPGVVWRTGRWDATRPAARGRTLDFGALGSRAARSFPAGEIISAPRHVAARTIDAFIALPDDPWARGLERLTPLAGLAAPLAGWVAPLLTTFVDPTRVPDAATRARARFAIVASARRGFDHAQVRVSGHDVYALTARVVADAARALAAPSAALTAAIRDGGTRAPSQVFDAATALTALERDGALRIETSFARSVVEDPDVRSS